MTKSFDDFYFSVNEGIGLLDKIEEKNALQKGRFIGNLFNKFLKSAKRRIRPADYENTTPITQWGFQDLFGELTKRYNDPAKEKRKYFIKELFQGIFNPNKSKETHPLFANDNIEEVDVASFYKTNNGGNIILYQLKDAEGNDKFYVSTDGKAEKFFASPAKQGGLGMLFKAWLTNQKSNKNIFPDQGAVVSKPKFPVKVIDKATYDKLVPVESIKFDEWEEVDEAAPKKGRSVVWNTKEFYFSPYDRFKSAKSLTGLESATLRPDDWVVDENGEKTSKYKDQLEMLKKFDNDQSKLQQMDSEKVTKWITGEMSEDQFEKALDEKKPEEKKPEDTGKEKPEEKKPNEKNGNEIDTDEKKMGELYNKLKNELEEKPRKFSSNNIEAGWIYDLKGTDVIYAYKAKDGSYKISWKPAKGKARDLLAKLGYVEREDIKELK